MPTVNDFVGFVSFAQSSYTAVRYSRSSNFKCYFLPVNLSFGE